MQLKKKTQDMAIKMSMKAVDDDDKTRSLLMLCSCLGPNIPKNLLQALSNSNKIDDMIQTLRQHALISDLRKTAKNGKEEVIMHGLVQEVGREHYKDQLMSDWYESIFEKIHKIKQDGVDEEDEGSYREKRYLLPHLQSLLKHYRKRWPDNAVALTLAPILIDIGDLSFSLGEYLSAKSIYEEALSIQRKENNENKNVLKKTSSLLNKLGLTHTKLVGGDSNKKSVELHKEALAIKERCYPENDPEIAKTLEFLARNYRIIDMKEALNMHLRALKIKQKNYPEDHIQIAISQEYVGRAYRTTGDAKVAIKYHERALKIRENKFGKDNIETANIRDELGRDYRYLDVKKAKEFHEHCVNIKRDFFVKNNIEIAVVLDQLGRDCRMLGDLKQAAQLHEEAFEIKKIHFEGNMSSKEIGYSLDYLGRVYRDLGKTRDAVSLFETAINAKIKDYKDPDHFEVALTRDHLARAYRDLGRTEEALEIHSKVLEIKKKYYGEENLDKVIEIALTKDQLGRDCRKLGDFVQAKMWHEEALEIKKQYYGNDNHPEIAETYTNLGSTYISLQDIEKGEKYLKLALEIKKDYYGAGSPALVETLIELTNAYKLKDIKQSREYLENAIEIRKKYFGENHALTEDVKKLIDTFNIKHSVNNKKRPRM